MIIYIASDHRGYGLKGRLVSWLTEWSHDVQDMGPGSYDPGDDYPDYISKVGKSISDNPDSNKARGIVIGHSGYGEAIVANKFNGVRAVVFYGGPQDLVKLSRQHNDANVLSLSASFLDDEAVKKVVKTWLDTRFSADQRHIRRINKIKEIEKQS